MKGDSEPKNVAGAVARNIRKGERVELIGTCVCVCICVRICASACMDCNSLTSHTHAFPARTGIGASSVCKAVHAVCYSRMHLEQNEIDVVFRAQFVTIPQEQGTLNAVKLVILAQQI